MDFIIYANQTMLQKVSQSINQSIKQGGKPITLAITFLILDITRSETNN